jgi:hypothetical protein
MDNTLTIAELVERYNDCDARISSLEAEAKRLKEERKGHELEILAYLEAQGAVMSGVGDTIVSMEVKRHPQVTDWAVFYEYLHERKAYYLLQRRVSTTAIKELADLEEIPGISFYEEPTLKTRKKR